MVKKFVVLAVFFVALCFAGLLLVVACLKSCFRPRIGGWSPQPVFRSLLSEVLFLLFAQPTTGTASRLHG
jgi:hypothetical protein